MKKIIIMLVLSIITSASAMESVMNITDSFTEKKLYDFIYLYEDPRAALITNNLLSEKVNFKKPDFKSVYKRSHYWIKLIINNKSSSLNEFIFEHNNNFDLPMDMEVYVENENGKISRSPMLTHVYKYNNPIFYIYLKRNRNTSIFIKCNTERFFSLNFKIYEKNHFINKMIGDRTVFGILIGSIIILFFYNLFIFFSTKKNEYLFFNQFLLVYFIYQMILFHYIFDIIPCLANIQNQIYLFKEPFLIFSGVLFANNYLKTKMTMPLLRVSSFILSAILGIITTLIIFNKHFLLVNLDNYVMLITIFNILLLGIFAIIRKYRPAIFFLLATFSFIILGLFNILSSYINFLPFGSYQLQNLTTIVMLLFFSLGLADFINTLTKEKINAQSESIDNLHKADRLKDEFLANTSHELRTPLHGIIAIAESLKNGIAGNLSDIAEYNLNLIITSGRRLNNLINDILDYSKLKYQDIILKKKQIDIKSIIDIIIKLLSPTITEKKLLIENLIPSTANYVIADEQRLYQILYNLIGNAVKFTDSGKIMITSCSKEDFLEISIIDTGIGISEDGMKRIFNYFEQIDKSDTKRYGGTGLGLAITKHLIELHGGHIEASSVEGRGSTFKFTLPVSKQEKIRVDEIKGENETYIYNTRTINGYDMDSKEKEHIILLVDDDPVNLQIIKNQLTSPNYALLFATNGDEALKLINQNEKIDLVLLDIMMPGMSGYDVCYRIRENYNLVEKPVIFLTAKNQVEDIAIGFEAGANDYLVKPFHQKELLSRVKTLLRLKKITQVNEVLKSANIFKTDLMNIAAHDLKNPLSAVLVYIFAIKKDKNCTSDILKYLNSMEKSVEKMKFFIEELLENSKLEEGKIMLEKTEFDISSLISEIVDGFHQIAKSKKQKIIFIKNNIDIHVCMDKSKISKIFDNLISNAIKYSETNKEIKIILEKNIDHILVKIKDNGPGLTEVDKLRIFQRYQNISTLPTGGEVSTGLGLSITKELVEMHGGEIWVESEQGSGSEFCVKFPYT